MTQNESEIDRLVRAVVGIILLLVGLSVGQGVWQIVLYVLSGVMLITSFTGFCLLYKIFGIVTNK
jgi:hypothetical protein